jgi:hypothetical protein
LGTAQFQNKEFFYRKLSGRELQCESQMPIGGYFLDKNSTTERPLLPFHAPMYIPSISDASKSIHIEFFFVLMRKEERRLITFQNTIYPYPGGHKLAELLARKGFFYTLLNTTTQCAFCRVVVCNLSLLGDIDKIHLDASPNCKFAKGEECHNIIKPPINETPITLDENNTTNQATNQCKVCLINQVNVVFQCGHLVMCNSCASHEKMKNCPICRRPLFGKIRIYYS